MRVIPPLTKDNPVHTEFTTVQTPSWPRAGLSRAGSGLACPTSTPCFLVCMLTHRYLRDVARCKEKYGRDWDVYCARVRYALVPGVF
jgi:hypothetical protein